jgi:hypothetical protein
LIVELFSTVSGARAAEVGGGAAVVRGGGATVVRDTVVGCGPVDVLADGEPVERDGDAGEVTTDGDGAGAAPDGPESPPPSATTPTTSNTTPSSATSAPINRARPGAASVDRSPSTGGLPPGDDRVVVDAARCSPSGWSPEPPVRSSNE